MIYIAAQTFIQPPDVKWVGVFPVVFGVLGAWVLHRSLLRSRVALIANFEGITITSVHNLFKKRHIPWDMVKDIYVYRKRVKDMPGVHHSYLAIELHDSEFLARQSFIGRYEDWITFLTYKDGQAQVYIPAALIQESLEKAVEDLKEMKSANLSVR